MLKLSRSPLSYRGQFVRWGILGFCSTPLLGTLFYNQGYRIAFLVCPVRHFTGIPCPTCGMTRSFMAIARGNLEQAASENVFGIILFTSFFIAVIHVAVELLLKRQMTAFYCQLIKIKKIHSITFFIALLYYILRLFHLFKTGELYISFIHSPLGQFLLSIQVH
ncbi:MULTISPECIES: DUF2752 domain-containing protein [Nostocales]|uniref:DUF2752 domain-containing protein n=3 Tax=Nostocales TaxID=1161 RepID=A0A0C1QW33_9CYAN|nr:DUF2752 domain-containing protein [Tolypothrix bouteillei]KAF3888506.1 DUF2752 domain-containing protein [Tolypothrix bouteillei VB521301]